MTDPTLRTVLVANRGEIACRIIETLRRLGIRAVAVHSDADARARHVALADVAVRLGPAPAAQSYLDVDAVVAAAVATGADAIHPGYGFLAENPELARACARAGIVFVGPSVAALEVMADKIAAKRLVAGRGVPVVPGTTSAGLDDVDLAGAAADVGFPLLVKPSAGGGGKGMQVVHDAAGLPAALASARRVAAAAFGDDTLLLERLVTRPRHIEVQVLADRHGNVVHLGERECSLQRRHQKVVEEAPSPLLDDAARARMGAAACEVARSVDYEGAGTVEFLVPADDPATFFFIEMNTRLQVEHPVTEMVTRLDLVELQLQVAAGEPLGLVQDDVVLRGHAVEARIYAESPARGFLPATGTVLALHEPTGPGWRLDSGLVEGDAVTGHYDPLLAKAVAWGPDRPAALRRLDALLAQTVVLGVETNVAFCRELLAVPDVRDGHLDTALIDRLLTPSDDQTLGGPGRVVEDDLVAVALLLRAAAEGGSSVWGAGDGWRLNAPARPRRFVLHDAGAPGRARTYEVSVAGEAGAAVVQVDDGAPRPAALVAEAGATHAWRCTIDGVSARVHLALDHDGVVWLARAGRTVAVAAPDRAERSARLRAERGRSVVPGARSPEVRAAMPGTVVAVADLDGGRVEEGAPLVTVEAMKMEHALVAPHAGTAHVSVRPGDLVRLDQVVAVVDPDPDPDLVSGSPTGSPDGPPHPDTQGAS
ncbi:acetyl/propionyl/methylcrotonyl-CoA carboxylase subunit alpha [Oerskovia flava]|uniref:acetyl/propionyl/methylcrotonyl-CoA carboxylase subunit alpha n=1 Tax=Oerskovia flava TaxID=2986422 RepID=UPI00223ED07A|nr:biotin carboxylase N-terminal domain-containing protein [Oerskovia sp. JB1-3-2]